ncbi:M24 family metallopeptidase [Actinokineospora spheciospongiae]|uniref:M24 family metallopeptidase n=1 Tax=Actinokineospora spheciospongiae TaxID=909613 RepID=UPI000D716BBF|nr:Xaa-Pro peptidase family protein [Actinokineospora spheciospongiae]PWW54161.1 Xaa-Pro aminopeptidase [Actinokineospora spheciospongiae]
MAVHARRRDALRKELSDRGLDGLLVTDLLNIRYLTGFTGSNAALLVTHSEETTLFCTDSRYTEQSASQVPDLAKVIDRASALALADKASGAVGFESQHVTVDGHDALAGATRATLTRAPNLVEGLRLVKDETEVDALRRACAAADNALADLVEAGGLVGRSEKEVARDLENRMRDHGAEGPSFESIVATGAHSAIPHHRPTDAVLAAGDFLKLDFGALVDGYHSDMTRTLVLTRAADWQRDLYGLVARSQAAGVAALAPGVPTRDVDRAARGVIEDAGRGEEFLHGLGHGVGLQVHEAPSLAKTSVGTLSAGMAVTVEPGVYVSGKGGVRIEDTLVVRDAGPELLTLTTKQLMVV